MLNALQCFQFGANPLRSVRREGEPWFVASDICAALGLKNPRQVIAELDDDEKGVQIMDTLGGAQEMNIVSESGLYSLIFRSRKPEAKLFRKWVTGEVLPSIRRTGGFTLAGADPVKSLTAGMRAVDRALRIGGPKAGADVWNSLGLPQIRAEAAGTTDDELLEPLQDYLATQTAVTVPEVLAALDIAAADQVMKRRVARLIRIAGWESRIERLGEKVALVFRPLPE